MIYGITLLILLTIIASVLKKEKVILMLVICLPFHAFIKNALDFYVGGGNIFAFWKEIVVVILLFKVIISKHYKGDTKINMPLMFFFFIVIISAIFSPSINSALPVLRDHIFPGILFIAITMIALDRLFVKQLLISSGIVSLISGILGFVQTFWLNTPISLIMGRIEEIDPSGYIKYTTNSARIMGFERMTGILGGPNTFGMYLAIMIIVLVMSLFTLRGYKLLTSAQRKLLQLSLSVCVIALLFSFSRAGWLIAGVGSFAVLYFSGFRIKFKYIFYLLFFTLVTYLVLAIYYPWTIDVVVASLSGKEASVADRGNNFMSALTVILEEPLGHGLGVTDLRGKTQVRFFAESAFMNIAYELSLMSLFLVLFIQFAIIQRSIKNQFKYNFFAKLGVAIIIPTIIASFISINTYGMPYVYLWWMFMALGINKSFNQKYNDKILNHNSNLQC